MLKYCANRANDFNTAIIGIFNQILKVYQAELRLNILILILHYFNIYYTLYL
jgi:hypothetical protein